MTRRGELLRRDEQADPSLVEPRPRPFLDQFEHDADPRRDVLQPPDEPRKYHDRDIVRRSDSESSRGARRIERSRRIDDRPGPVEHRSNLWRACFCKRERNIPFPFVTSDVSPT
ncbi:hypothetical protein GCM10008023_00130 [Sphingomonas glacialis]|uniref:Uncharacterized protein n=2 Tax=Sphingomonas glacialis TaxID=658225 RepID=A0ABQ3L6G5_9SPHN|nr:hypothetical protein GCM10008023_00130 [Sphingomonas glacialis]